MKRYKSQLDEALQDKTTYGECRAKKHLKPTHVPEVIKDKNHEWAAISSLPNKYWAEEDFYRGVYLDTVMCSWCGILYKELRNAYELGTKSPQSQDKDTK